MKRILLIGLLFVGTIITQAQNKTVSLQACANDTLKYIITNFEQNKNQYIGKPAKQLLDELDIEIKSFIPLRTPENHIDPAMAGKVTGVLLSYLYPDTEREYKKCKRRYQTINISFEPPLLNEEAVLSLKGWWGKGSYNRFKNCIIKDINVKQYGKKKKK